MKDCKRFENVIKEQIKNTTKNILNSLNREDREDNEKRYANFDENIE